MLRPFRATEFPKVPIYEYACGSCEHRFETIQKASEEPLRDCPSCGHSALKKLLSAPVFRLKGSGWYETDFKTGDKKNVAGDSTPSDNGGEATGKAAGKESNGGSAANKSSQQDAAPEKRTADSADKKASKKPPSEPKPAATAKYKNG